MPEYGLLIDYYWCIGCHACEVACKQELNLPAGVWGIKVYELTQESNGRLSIDYFPFPTDLCNLCEHRTKLGKKPSCVQHCMTSCIIYGRIEDLAKELQKKPKRVLWAHRA